MATGLCISINQEWLSPDRRLISWQVLGRQEVGKFTKSGQITETSGSESEENHTS